MAAQPPQVLLFDFFGTLVRYEQSWTGLEYPATHALLDEWSGPIAYEVFVAQWDAAYQRLESHSQATLEEHAGAQVVDGLCEWWSLPLDPDRRSELLATYLDEWSAGVRPIEGVSDMVRRLAETHRLGIVSNTHNSRLVHDLAGRCEIPDVFEVTVLSIDHGYRKPHPSIYQAALDHFACSPTSAVFVGDSLEPDYLGPRRLGVPALLIDSEDRHAEVPDEHRLHSILDLEARLVELRPNRT